jgi:hypothetical protein
VLDGEIVTSVMKNVDHRLRPIAISPEQNVGASWFADKGLSVGGKGSFRGMRLLHFPSQPSLPTAIDGGAGYRSPRTGWREPSRFLACLPCRTTGLTFFSAQL